MGVVREGRPAVGGLAAHVELDGRDTARASEQRDAARDERVDEAVANGHGEMFPRWAC